MEVYKNWNLEKKNNVKNKECFQREASDNQDT